MSNVTHMTSNSTSLTSYSTLLTSNFTHLTSIVAKSASLRGKSFLHNFKISSCKLIKYFVTTFLSVSPVLVVTYVFTMHLSFPMVTRTRPRKSCLGIDSKSIFEVLFSVLMSFEIVHKL